MRGNEFIRKILKYAKATGIACEWRVDRGKGSHGVLTLGDKRTRGAQPKGRIEDRHLSRHA